MRMLKRHERCHFSFGVGDMGACTAHGDCTPQVNALMASNACHYIYVYVCSFFLLRKELCLKDRIMYACVYDVFVCV